MQMIGNCAGAAVGFIFSAQTAPRYYQGLYVAMGALIIVICNVGLQASNDLTRKDQMNNDTGLGYSSREHTKIRIGAGRCPRRAREGR